MVRGVRDPAQVPELQEDFPILGVDSVSDLQEGEEADICWGKTAIIGLHAEVFHPLHSVICVLCDIGLSTNYLHLHLLPPGNMLWEVDLWGPCPASGLFTCKAGERRRARGWPNR